MAYIQLADANPALAKEWAREMMNARIVLEKMHDQSPQAQEWAIEILNRAPTSIEDVRHAFLELNRNESALLFIETDKLRTANGNRIREIAETMGLEIAGIYIDRQNTDVFVCRASDMKAKDED